MTPANPLRCTTAELLARFSLADDTCSGHVRVSGVVHLGECFLVSGGRIAFGVTSLVRKLHKAWGGRRSDVGLAMYRLTPASVLPVWTMYRHADAEPVRQGFGFIRSHFD